MKLNEVDQFWYGENEQKTHIYFWTFLLSLIQISKLVILGTQWNAKGDLSVSEITDVKQTRKT